jgi:hypothetical protein
VAVILTKNETIFFYVEEVVVKECSSYYTLLSYITTSFLG